VKPVGAEAAAQLALETFVEDGQVLGLGTGRAASAFVRALGERVAQGLRVRGVATSEATARLAREVGVPLLSLDEAERLDATFDGADEVDPHLDCIKGYGGAHVREKVVAACSRRLVILVGPEKLVGKLGERGRLPVEMVPFAWPLCRRRLAELGCEPAVRRGDDGGPVVSDNGNWILDCRVGPLEEPAALDSELCRIPGVVGTGLFVGLAHAVAVGGPDGAELRRRVEG